MKKIFTLFIVFAAFITAAVKGQCNANFNFTVNGANGIVQFLPVSILPTDHLWSFGDGSSSIEDSPSHQYNPGVYTVMHVVTYYSPNDSSVLCSDTVLRALTIAGQPACTIQAGYSFIRDSANTNTVYFTNLSSGTNPNTVTFWNFGDGTSSYEANPVHTFTTSGAYNVCLKVSNSNDCTDSTCRIVQVQVPVNNCNNLQVNFTAVADSSNPNTYYFSNISQPVLPTDSATWYFGDGSVAHDFYATSHTYANAGTYNVCLVIKRAATSSNGVCVKESCGFITVQAACNIEPRFTVQQSPVTQPLTFSFVNTSLNMSAADSAIWDFGDGNSAVNQNAVTHTYAAPGSYVACLKLIKVQPGTINVICTRTSCQQVSAVAPPQPCNLQVSFTDTIFNNNTVSFTNTSTPLSPTDTVSWSFGDGSSSADVNATHTYNQPGTYTVCLIVRKAQTNNSAACVSEFCKAITIVPPTNPCSDLQLAFTWVRDSANNRKVNFINQSSPVTTDIFYNWSFGDGTNSLAYSPQHIYTQPGTYQVCLRMQRANCVKDSCTTVVIQPAADTCTIQAGFTTQLDPLNRRRVYFTNTTATASSAANALWSFGDGTTSNAWNPVHEYVLPGRYAICLTVRQGGNSNCTSTTCDSVFVPGNVIPPVNCDSFRIGLGYRRDDYMPNKIFFFATGNAPVYNQQWTITPLNGGNADTIYQNNPVYVFADTGRYVVCVNGAFSNNCSKDTCDEITIFSTATPQQCVVNAYPNPANSSVTYNIQMTQPGIINSVVTNSQGVILMQATQNGFTGNNQVTLNVQNLPTGFYTVRIIYNGQVCFTRFQKI